MARSKKEYRKRKSKQQNEAGKVCQGGPCCQAITQNGTRCTRKAKIKLDLTKGKKIMNYTVIPKINCCFFCVQHTAVITGYAMYQIGMLLATKDLSWDEYVVINPDYLDKKMVEWSS